MRLPLLAAALTAVAATAIPANAAIFPVCTTRLAAVNAGESASCSTGPASWGNGNRVMNVQAHNGAVDATLSCGFYPNVRSTTVRVYAHGTATRSMYEYYNSNYCTVTLTAVTPLAVASATSHSVPIVLR